MEQVHTYDYASQVEFLNYTRSHLKQALRYMNIASSYEHQNAIEPSDAYDMLADKLMDLMHQVDSLQDAVAPFAEYTRQR